MLYIVVSDTEVISQHNDVQSARDAAQADSLRTPGTNFWVYAPNIHYIASAPNVTWNYCSNTGVPI